MASWKSPLVTGVQYSASETVRAVTLMPALPASSAISFAASL